MPETGVNFAQHLYSSRMQTQTSPVCPESWGLRGCSQEAKCTELSTLQYPALNAKMPRHNELDLASSSQIWQAEGRPKSHFLGLPAPECQKGNKLMSSSHCTTKKDSTTASCPALTLSHCKGQVLLVPRLQNSVSLSRKHALMLLFSHLGLKQHKKLAGLCPVSHQRQNSPETEPETPVSVSPWKNSESLQRKSPGQLLFQPQN